MKKYALISIFIVLIIFALIYFLAFHPLFLILNGYTAKRVCSSHFIAERSLEAIEQQDLIYPATWSSSTIDEEHRIVHSSIIGMAKQSAQFRAGFGCTIKNIGTKLKAVPSLNRNIETEAYWPHGNATRDTVYVNVDYKRLKDAVKSAFGTVDKTRAVIVAQKGNILIEIYEDGFDIDTELLGWSMSKSIANNLVGILVRQGRISIDKKKLLPEWSDERSLISLDYLLHMSSDLDWNEENGYLSDVTRMLYLNDNASNYAIKKPIKQEIGTSYIYSSGTTNIISKIIKNTFESEEDYLRFPHESLFNKIGIDATMELDGGNNFIMSSYTYMTARDWCKLGQFWLQNGKWKDEQILPKDWMTYSTKSGLGVNGIYGAHFWLNDDSFLYQDVPSDMYAARGFQGQQIIVIPSREMVIVRFGVDEGLETFNFNKFISSILASIN